jgi:hypothetical protein
MIKITKLPPGEAIGARDLQLWQQRRTVGRGGIYKKHADTRRVYIRCKVCRFLNELEVYWKNIETLKFKCMKCDSKDVEVGRRKKDSHGKWRTEYPAETLKRNRASYSKSKYEKVPAKVTTFAEDECCNYKPDPDEKAPWED